ncbi:MAG TPA: cytochrome c-type biogenesis protein [Xanthobacteraceae bacterium]|jgi:cytochrome c-type biogenesis protein CcmH
MKTRVRSRLCLQLVALVFMLLASPPLKAVQPDEMLSDPALEARARALSQELRCMVCQNESIDDSEAPLAHDLRVLVRERLKAGDSDAQVLDFLVARYGEFVLLRPRLSWHTAALWGFPLGVVLTGIVTLIVVARRRSATQSSAQSARLSAAEEARLAELLRDGSASQGGVVGQDGERRRSVAAPRDNWNTHITNF